MTCAVCGRANRDGARACDECGARFDGGDPLREDAPRTSRRLPDALLASRSALEGERKQLTVLFAVCLERATMLSDESGARRQDPILATERARLARARGDEASCAASLAEARRLYAALDLPHHAARLDRWHTTTPD